MGVLEKVRAMLEQVPDDAFLATFKQETAGGTIAVFSQGGLARAVDPGGCGAIAASQS